MKLNINIPATPKRTKILAAFMAFLIFALTFQEAFVGWNFGMRVSALTPGNGDIHSTSANKTSKYTDRMNENRTGTNNHGSTGSTFTYTGKYVNNNTTTLFDYLTDREIAGTYNDCWQK